MGSVHHNGDYAPNVNSTLKNLRTLERLLAERTKQFEILTKDLKLVRNELMEKNKIIRDYELLTKNAAAIKEKELKALRDELMHRNSVIRGQQQTIDKLMSKIRKLNCLVPPTRYEEQEHQPKVATPHRSRGQGISAEPEAHKNRLYVSTNIEDFFCAKSQSSVKASVDCKEDPRFQNAYNSEARARLFGLPDLSGTMANDDLLTASCTRDEFLYKKL